MKFFAAIKDRYNDLRRRQPWKVLLNKYFLLTLLTASLTLVFNTNNIATWVEARRTLHQQRIQIRTLKEGIKDTDTKISRLKSQKDSLEKFAREEYLYHESGEDVYIIE